MADFRSPFFSNANRVVFTNSGAYNPKKKKGNSVIADIRDAQKIRNLYRCLEIIYDPNPETTGWMSPPDYTITSMNDKEVIDSVNVVLKGWLRKAAWKSDYSLIRYEDYRDWLSENIIDVPSI